MGAGPYNGWLSRLRRRRSARQWRQIADGAAGLGTGAKRRLRDEAKGLRSDLDRFLRSLDRRAGQSLAALGRVSLPPGTDWRWRPGFLAAALSPSGLAGPANGQRLSDEVALWHDCAASALILRQQVSHRATDLAPFDLLLEVFRFSGSYLSLSIDLPPQALAGLTKSHILRLDSAIAVEHPIAIYARLNIGHGPNTEQVLRHLGDMRAGQPAHLVTEFDLAYTEMNEKRLDKIWLDLIFEAPGMNAIEISELFMSRHLRADM